MRVVGFSDFAFEANFEVSDFGAGRQVEKIFEFGVFFESDVKDLPARFILEMAMVAEVGTVTGGIALDIDLANELVGNQGIEAVVDGGEGDGGHAFLSAEENVVGGGVVAVSKENGEDFAALFGHA